MRLSRQQLGPIGYAITAAMQDQRWRDQRDWFTLRRLDALPYQKHRALLVDWNWRW